MLSQKNTHPQSLLPPLDELAALYGVNTRYRDSKGRWCQSPPESVRAVLSAMGAEVEAELEQGAPRARLQAAIGARRAELDARLVEPVLVAWDGIMQPIVVRLPVRGDSKVELILTLEGGERRQWSGAVSASEARGGLPRSGWGLLPFGYHQLYVRAGSSVGEATVISAPRRCWAPGQGDVREWGVFAPLYALRSERDWGAGDLADLESLGDAVGAAGGSAVGVLPLLAAFLNEPFEPAPYRPVSRLFWNEFYLAVDRIAEWERCSEARDLWAATDTQAQIARLRARDLVAYNETMAVKRQVLERLERCFREGAGQERTQALADYVRFHPDVSDYAAFRARPEVSRDRREEVRRYHLYCQWQMEQQMDRLARPQRPGLFLDLPVGVHPEGFDTWRWPELFAGRVSFGAPPDTFFAKGQDWDSRPLRPESMRAQGHRYFAQCLRHHMRHARYLRVDHVMALHRLFWIPEGADAVDGVYVDYPAEELYAVLCLESWRNRTVVAGEDLGTVPAGVRASMRRHGVLSTWVLQASIRPRAADPLRAVPRHVVASLGTHDMVPLAGFSRGGDIDARLRTGQVDAAGARREAAARHRLMGRLSAWLQAWTAASDIKLPTVDSERDAEESLLQASLAYLASSPAALVMINLDDLLLETEPQNLPGTGAEEPNWRRRLRGTQGHVHMAIVRVGSLLASCGRPGSREAGGG